jgi:hypothetical protein
VTPDEIGDPHQLELRTWVNGEQRQHSNTKHLIFDCFACVETLSTVFTLEPGLVVTTGTPSGRRRAAARYLKEGDVVRIEIERIGPHRESRRRRAHDDGDRPSESRPVGRRRRHRFVPGTRSVPRVRWIPAHRIRVAVGRIRRPWFVPLCVPRCVSSSIGAARWRPYEPTASGGFTSRPRTDGSIAPVSGTSGDGS